MNEDKIIKDERFELFLSTYKEFEWFIIEYFGEDTMNKAKKFAEENDYDLFLFLDDIWFALPDDKFNIKENPKGWKEFLNIIEI